MDRVSDHHRSTDSLSGCIWNDTVVPFCSFLWGTLRKDSTFFFLILFSNQNQLE